VLSHAVLDLEEALGVELFVRPAERTELTDAGRALLEQAHLRIAAEDLADVGAREAEDAIRPFTIGIMPGVTVSKWTRLWAERRPEDPLKVLRTAMEDQVSALHRGLVDVSFVRLPIASTGLSTIALYAEIPVVMVPKDHPATLLDMVTVADLVDEHLLQDPDDVPEWRDAAVAGRTVERRPLPEMRTMADAVALVAAGIGVVIVPQSVARMHHRKDVTYLPVADVAESHVALAWVAERATPDIEEFIGIVRGRSPRSSRATPTPAREAAARSPEPGSGRAGAGGAKGATSASRKSAKAGKAAPKSRRGRR
jgi:DNA-binding transcriptional LysR family regulator